jgi:HK97 family phage major capsid protein
MDRLQEIAKRMQEIRSALGGTDQVDVAALTAEVDALTAEKGQIEARNTLMNKIPSGAVVPNPEQRGVVIDAVDKFASVEYRQAFMEFAKTGKAIPAGYEVRSDAFTAVSDATAVVPTTILDEIIKQMKTYGHIFARVRKTAIKGGVTVPILSLKPSATWINEATVSDRLKVTANTNVTFSYYGLECKVATSLLADTVTLASFESTILSLIVEAMTKAIDTAIIKGSGTGSPLGITIDSRVPAGNIITLGSSDFTSWEGWKKKVVAKIPLSYRAGGSWIMAAGTFEGYIDGMTDANGQPIGRVNHGITEGPQERFNGREVILVEDDIIGPYDAAATNDIVAIFCKLSDYVINSNMQLAMYRWLDHDTNQWVDKALLIADGKILDPNGVMIIKKGA